LAEAKAAAKEAKAAQRAAKVSMREATQSGQKQHVEEDKEEAAAKRRKKEEKEGEELDEAAKERKKAERAERKAKMAEEESEEIANFEADLKNHDYCDTCGDTGGLVCCDGCPNAFHVDCLGFKDGNELSEPWYCPDCEQLQLDGKKYKTATAGQASWQSEAPRVQARLAPEAFPPRVTQVRPHRSKTRQQGSRCYLRLRICGLDACGHDQGIGQLMR